MDDQKNKADAGKSNPCLLEVGCAAALELVNRTLDYGYEKYVDPKNPPSSPSWKLVPMHKYDAAAKRHRKQRDKHGPMNVDHESGLVHLAHEIICDLFMLQTLIESNPGYDFLTYNPPPRVWMGEKVRGELDAKGTNEHLFRRPEVGVRVFEDKERSNFGPADMPQRHPPTDVSK